MRNDRKLAILGAILLLVGGVTGFVLSAVRVRDSIIINSGLRALKSYWTIDYALLISGGIIMAIALGMSWLSAKRRTKQEPIHEVDLNRKQDLRDYLVNANQVLQCNDSSHEIIERLIEQFDEIDRAQARLENLEKSFGGKDSRSTISNRLQVFADHFKNLLQQIEDDVIVASVRKCVARHVATGDLEIFIQTASEAVEKNARSLEQVRTAMATLGKFIATGDESDEALGDLQLQIEAMKNAESAD